MFTLSSGNLRNGSAYGRLYPLTVASPDPRRERALTRWRDLNARITIPVPTISSTARGACGRCTHVGDYRQRDDLGNRDRGDLAACPAGRCIDCIDREQLLLDGRRDDQARDLLAV